MKNKVRKQFRMAGSLLAAFALWTAVVCLVDVKAIGPEGSTVGLAAINGFLHNLTGAHMDLYELTDWLGLVPVGTAMGFALLGLAQWIRRKKLSKTDSSILVLGGFYLVVLSAYVFFELFAVNYRPILINGRLEASYPSSTTLLTMCVMLTAIMQCRSRIKNNVLRRGAILIITVFLAFMVVGRFVSGVHWFTDIVGAVLLSAGLVTMYDAICGLVSSTH